MSGGMRCVCWPRSTSSNGGRVSSFSTSRSAAGRVSISISTGSRNGTVSAVIDWEMAALGPAEVDVAWWLFFDDLFSTGMGVTRLEGLPDRLTSISWYESFAGRRLENMDYYDVLATFRMAIVGMRAVAGPRKRSGSGSTPHAAARSVWAADRYSQCSAVSRNPCRWFHNRTDTRCRRRISRRMRNRSHVRSGTVFRCRERGVVSQDTAAVGSTRRFG